MRKKIVLWLTAFILLAGWPVSFFINPPKIEAGFIWQLNDAGEEKKLLTEKLGLSTSQIKRVFYNKTTIISDRFVKNILAAVDLNNYFFSNPLKFPYPAIVGFLIGVWVSIKRKKYFKLWIAGGVVLLLISFFKKMDGWNLVIYPLIAIVTIEGLKEISRHRFGWLLLLLMAVIGLTEIGRVVPW